jgi:hypothetical protein
LGISDLAFIAFIFPVIFCIVVDALNRFDSEMRADCRSELISMSQLLRYSKDVS